MFHIVILTSAYIKYFGLMNKGGKISKETVLLRWWESRTGSFSIID